MMRIAKRVTGLVLAVGLGLGGAGLTTGAWAQADLFTPAVMVNGLVITRFEVQQRAAFLKVVNQGGDVEKAAVDGLIADRLEADAAKALGAAVTEADVSAGMDEFAARGNLTTDAFLKVLADNGVQPQTFRDFVKAGALWRAALRAKYAGRIRVSDAEVDRAIALGAASGGTLRVLLSEIVMLDDGKTDLATSAARIKEKVKSEADFGMEAKLYSKVATAAGGGALGWIDVSALPPEVAGAVTKLKPGEMTPPIPQKGSLTLYFLRDESQGPGPAKGAPQVDYALFQPGAGADLAKAKASLTGCDQLNVAARGLPVAALQRQTVAEAALPAGLRAAMAGLDAGESTVVTADNGQPALVMLCARTPQSQVTPSRDDVTTDLLNHKLGLLAQAYLEELRSQAIIVTQ